MRQITKRARAKAHAGEIAGGQSTVEYVIVIGVVVGLGIILVAFRDAIGKAVTDAGANITQLFGKITDGAVSSS